MNMDHSQQSKEQQGPQDASITRAPQVSQHLILVIIRLGVLMAFKDVRFWWTGRWRRFLSPVKGCAPVESGLEHAGFDQIESGIRWRRRVAIWLRRQLVLRRLKRRCACGKALAFHCRRADDNSGVFREGIRDFCRIHHDAGLEALTFDKHPEIR